METLKGVIFVSFTLWFSIIAAKSIKFIFNLNKDYEIGLTILFWVIILIAFLWVDFAFNKYVSPKIDFGIKFTKDRLLLSIQLLYKRIKVGVDMLGKVFLISWKYVLAFITIVVIFQIFFRYETITIGQWNLPAKIDRITGKVWVWQGGVWKCLNCNKEKR